MKVRIADFIADFLVENGITHNFSVPGGGAMYLNDGLGHKEGLKNIFCHHEQACAIAAESYARIKDQIPVVCVTTGPGGTNTLTGVLGAWLDSIPMLIISGQVRYETTARSTGLPLRALGDQEFDIVKIVDGMTKYAVMISEPKMVKYHLQKALFLAKAGRPGPSWVDVPLNIQGCTFETDDFVEFDPSECEEAVKPAISDEITAEIIERIKNAKRPVFNAGNGIRIAKAFPEFRKLTEKLNIPVVTGWDSIDLIEDDNPLYVGRAGIMGDRPGNFAVQNSDLVLSVGSRLGVRQVGYDVTKWAREAFVIMVDIDEAELQKPSIHVELPVHGDAKDFLEKMNHALEAQVLKPHKEWNEICQGWKKDYPVMRPEHFNKGQANVYCFIKELSSRLPEGRITVVGNGSACVVGSHAYVIKKDQRFVINSGAASMGYDLPAAAGAAFATEKQEEIICVTGDGSIQMNLQELETIVYHKLPIKLFVINNGGYHSMRQTQGNFFKGKLVGVGVDSHDLGFPSMEKLAAAYGMPYLSCHENERVAETVEKALSMDGYVMCEIFVTMDQKFEPKSATKRLPDGRLISPPLEDLQPFLSREELSKIMIIPMLEE